jgi:hypothetical protein
MAAHGTTLRTHELILKRPELDVSWKLGEAHPTVVELSCECF